MLRCCLRSLWLTKLRKFSICKLIGLFLILMVFATGLRVIVETAQQHMLTSIPLFAELRDMMPNGTRRKPAFLTDSFLRNNRDGKFPYEDECHYLGLRKQDKEDKDRNLPRLACKKHRPDYFACVAANRFSGVPGYVEHRICDDPRHTTICQFVRANVTSHKLVCDPQVCQGIPVAVGSLNPQQGRVTDWSEIEPFHTNKVLKKVEVNIQLGFEFCFMKCGTILQVLVFPPLLIKNSTFKPRNRFNFNIVVLDSTSRPHFYRMLPKSVAALRAIVYDESVPSTALDFEMFQAISQHTFDNIRPLFSGIVRGDAEFSSEVTKGQNPLGIGELFGEYQRNGYQTTFQEDICWYDSSGIMLTDLERRYVPSTPQEFEKRWKEFKEKVSKYRVDKYGLTHFSCHVFQQMGRTNFYEFPDKVCFNGRFFSSYFLEYLTATYRAIQDDDSARPMISYHHVNTGHVGYDGDRIRNIDSSLAEFFMKMAYNPHTLTIVLSDHGHTRTTYGKSFEGQMELFDPLFFMVLPYNVARLLGQHRVAALVENQHRLFTTADIHRALMSLHNPAKSQSRDSRVAGIFAVLPTNRTCADLPLLPLSRCKCEGWGEDVASNSPKLKWLAEFALGQLNNAIQKQYMKGQPTGKEMHGFGNCMRLVGRSYGFAFERQFAGDIITTFDLHVDPPRGSSEDEVFKIEVRHRMKPENGVAMGSYNRESLYSKFSTCADKSVDIKLCACAQESVDFTRTASAMKNFIQRPMFGAKTELEDLKTGCLFLMARRHLTFAFAYEVANICADKTFKVTMKGHERNMLLSQDLPITLIVKPTTIHFLISGVRYVINDSYFDKKVDVEVI